MKAKFTDAQLHQCFDNVKDKANWKNPIDALIDNPGPKNIECLEEAIIHFTGSIPKIVYLPNNKVRVLADGYYAMEAAVEAALF